MSCCNFIGYNLKYGSDFVHNYSCANVSVVNLIGEIIETIVFLFMDFISTCLI